MTECEIFVAFNRVIARIRALRGGNIDGIMVRSASGITLVEHDANISGGGRPANRLRTFNRQVVVHTFVSPPFERGELPALLQKRVEVHVRQGDNFEVQRLRPIAMTLQQFALLDRQLVEFFANSDGLKQLVEALHADKIRKADAKQGRIDFAYRNSRAIFVSGWIPSFRAADSFMLSGGCAFVAGGREAIVVPRGDVSEQLRKAGIPFALDDDHGFAITLDAVPADGKIEILALTDDGLISCYDGVPATSGSLDEALQIAMGARLTRPDLPVGVVTSQVKPLLSSDHPTLEYDVANRASFDVKPSLSVIVPFYKEWRFIFPVLTMVRKAPSDWHWVLVCDDPEIFPRINAMVSQQATTIRQRLTVVRPRRNVGYGNANNLGAAEALGDKLLLMNADIWISDFEPIVESGKLLDDRQFDLLGYTLRFEDGTVQHDGLDLTRSDEVGGLYLAIHRGKGLPPQSEWSGRVREVSAVTGALMLISRATFQEVGGFSSLYIGGDFEDADLCLALTTGGRRIGIFETSHAYHLERQSIRKDATSGLAFMRTLINCETFNRRWAGTLDAQLARTGPR